MHALRTKAWNRRQRSKGRRGARLDFCQGLKMPRVDDLGDLAGEVLADPRQPDEVLPSATIFAALCGRSSTV